MTDTDSSPFFIKQAQPEHAACLEEIQRLCFPHLSERDLINKDHFLSQISVYPKGQQVLIHRETGKVVGSSSALKRPFSKESHSYLEETGHNTFHTHDNHAQWLYIADMGIHPDFQGKGLAKLLYTANDQLMISENLKGQIGGALPKGYHLASHLSIEEYVKEVISGKRNDPVLSIHLRYGFSVEGILPQYVDDPSCLNYGILIVKRR